MTYARGMSRHTWVQIPYAHIPLRVVGKAVYREPSRGSTHTGSGPRDGFEGVHNSVDMGSLLEMVI